MELVRLMISCFRLASQIVLVLLILTPVHGWGFEDKIVFVSKRNFTPEVFLVEGLNGRPIQLTQNMFASWPSMSPDGTDVVFVSRPPGGISNIFKLDILTRKIEKLTDNDVQDMRYTDLDWSLDGRQILFIKRLQILVNEPDQTVLCVLDMNTRDTRHILQPNLPTSIHHPSWSPDSKHILYLQLREFRKDAGLYLPTLFITDDNGNNVFEVSRDDLEILTVLSAVTVPTWSPSRSRIAYIGFIPAVETREIFSMNLKDESLSALTSGGAENKTPLAWRPDGMKILFSLSADIYVMDSDGENMINLTQSPERETTATWSPDGKQIAFSRSMREGEISIYVMGANGQNQQRLTFEPGISAWPHWSPDGDRIAFVSNRDGAFRVYAMDTNGQNIQQITPGQREFYAAPSWSRDGEWLAFRSGDKQHWGIYLIDPQGRNETLIVRSEVSELIGRAVSRPTWSPDSQHLVFNDPVQAEDLGLLRVSIDGGIPTHLNTDGLSYCAHPLWSPDGNSLIFSAFNRSWPSAVEQEIGLFLMNLDTLESRHFILPVIAELFFKSDFNLLRLVWAPDGSQLMLSIGQTRIADQGERRLYLIDIASETVRLWMDDAAEADWVSPDFVYAVNPRQKRIATWAQIKTF